MQRLLVLAALIFMVGVDAAHAGRVSCSILGGGYSAPPDQVIALCTKRIKSRRLRRNALEEAYDVRANAEMKKGSLDAAIADYSEAIKLDPTYAGYVVGRAIVYLRKKDFVHAVDDYSAAIKLDPKSDSYRQFRAGAYMAEDDFDHALADYAEAIRLKPDNPYYLDFQASAYLGKGDFAHAIANYTEELRIAHDNSTMIWLRHLNRGWAYRATGDYGHAIADYEAVIAQIPDKPRGYIDRGLAYFESGHDDQAEADMAHAVQLNPNWPHAVLLNYIFRAHHGRPSLAEIQAAASALESRHQNGIDLQVYNLFLGRAAPEALLAQLQTLPQIVSCNVRAYLGEWYLLRKQDDAAKENFQAVESTCARWSSDADLYPLAKAELRSLNARPQPAVNETVVMQTPGNIAPVAPFNAGHRIALVIGNSKYRNVPVLANPAHDAEMVAAILKRTGFEKVTLLEDLDKDAMVGALRNFSIEAEKADWAVIYYAGHGMEVGGVNYLIPVDARLATDRDISFEAVPLDQVMNAAERADKLRLVILDACRDNPFKNQMKRTLAVSSRSVSRGLAPVEPDPGTLVVYAAKAGEQASDGRGEHGPFATAFAKDVMIPGLEVRRLFDYVRDDVLDATHHEQQPFSYGSISGRDNFYFIAPVAKSGN